MQPLSGTGAELHGGRFNPKGVSALYLSIKPETAIKEANQAGSFQPVTLVAYDADFSKIFDATDPTKFPIHAMRHGDLGAMTWRDEMESSGEANTQKFARDLFNDGYQGMKVQSFVPNAAPGDFNMVIWVWSEILPAKLSYIDDENRLGSY